MKVSWTQFRDEFVTCAVIKDGGDDPDATHGAEICSTVQLTSDIGKILLMAELVLVELQNLDLVCK